MKRMKRLSLFLALTLVLTTCFARFENIYAGTVSNGTGVQISSVTAQDANSTEAVKTYVAKMTTGSDNVTVIPVTTKKAGTLAIPLEGIEVGKNVTVSLHTASSATDGNRIGSREYLSSSKTEDTLFAKLKKAGTYYVKFETSAYSAGTPQSVAFAAAVYPNGGTLKRGKIFYGASPDNNGVSYYKVTAPGNGYLTVSFPVRTADYSSFNIKLANSKKKSMYSNFEYLSSNKNYKTTIGVKKGTYYIAVKNSDSSFNIKLANSKKKSMYSNFEYLSSNKNYKTTIGVKKGTYYIAVKNSDSAYGIKVSYTGVKENCGTTRSKAKSITKGNTKKGIVTTTQSQNAGDWYKFKITKAQAVKFTFTVKSNGGGKSGGLKALFYQAGKSYSAASVNCYGDDQKSVQLYTYGKGNKLAPGTYYIKVQKYSAGNGYYTLKWN